MKVLIAVLAHTGWMHNQVAKCLLCLGVDQRYETRFIFVERRPVDDARNFIVNYALKHNHDYVLMMDHDNPCSKNPLDLIALDKDVIFCPTPIMKNHKAEINTNAIEGGLVEVEWGGTGCVLISKRAMKEIPKPLFRFKYDKTGISSEGEDVYFSKKARSSGIKLYAHTDYKCLHYYEMNVWDMLRKNDER